MKSQKKIILKNKKILGATKMMDFENTNSPKGHLKSFHKAPFSRWLRFYFQSFSKMLKQHQSFGEMLSNRPLIEDKN